MRSFRMMLLTSVAALPALTLVAGAAQAEETNFTNFNPVAPTIPAGSLPADQPFLLGNPDWKQRTVASRQEQLSLGQFNTGSWDMIDSNRTGPDAGRYLFTGFETGQAGIQRTDRVTGQTVTLYNAPVAAPAPGSAVAWDASRWTPFGTYLTAEESWGPQPQPFGRLFELTNPVTATAGTGNVVHRNAVARVSHEGLVFDKNNNLYYIDELNGGSIYKYTSATPNNGSTFFNGGVNSVLQVGNGNTPNATGASKWVAFTDATGAALPGAVTIVDPNGITSVDGRASADVAAFKGTDYQRPEDMEIKTKANGDQVVYVATTTTHEVYSINLTTGEVKRAMSRNTINKTTGLALGNTFTNPDNLAIDAAGNIYVVEDQPGGIANIYLIIDADADDVADSVLLWATLSTPGAEPTGLFFDPFNPNLAYVNVQHPDDQNDRLIEISAVPEPSGLALMASSIGLLGFAARRRFRK